MMKTLNYIKRYIAVFVMLLGITLSFTGCYEADPPMISVSKKIVRIDQQAQSVTITVTSNSEWSVESDASWCIPSRSAGRGTTDIELVVDACSSTSDRQAVVTLKTVGRDKTQTTVTISQSALNCILMLSPESVAVGNEATSVSFAVASNSDWTVTSSKEWAVPSVSSGNGNAIVKIAVAENTSHSVDRSATIEVVSGNEGSRVTEEFIIDQSSRDLPSFVLGHSALNFTAKAKTEGSNVARVFSITNITGEITVSSQFSWCNAVYTDGYVVVTVDDNTGNSARQCVVNVLADVEGEAVVKQIAVYQQGLGSPVLTLVKNNVTVGADCPGTSDGSFNVTVGYYSNTSSTKVTVVEDYPEWITNVNLGANTLSFNISRNSLPEERGTVITLKAVLSDETIYYPVTVTQRAEDKIELSLSQNYANFTAKADTLTLAACTNLANAEVIAYVSNASWCKVTTRTLASNYDITSVITVYVEENYNYDARTASVVIVGKSPDQRVYQAVSVFQAGVGTPNVAALESSIILPVDAVKYDDNYYINLTGVDDKTSVSAYSSANWLNARFSSERNKLQFTAESNISSSNSRYATVTVIAEKGGEKQLITVDVEQLGTGSATLLFETYEYDYPSVAKTYFIPVQCKNGTAYTVLETPAWLEAVPETGDGYLKVSLKQNTKASERNGTILILATNGDDVKYYYLSITQEGIGGPEFYPVASNIVIPQAGCMFTGSPANKYRVRIVTDDDSFTSIESVDEVSWLDTKVSDNNKYIMIEASANEHVESRTATVTLIGKRGGETITTTFTVTQSGTGSPGLLFPLSEYAVNLSTSTVIRFIELNGSDWTVSDIPAWLHVNNIERETIGGKNYGLVRVIADYNPDAYARSGEIIFKVHNGDESIFQSVTVVQQGIGGPEIIPAFTSFVYGAEETGTRFNFILNGDDFIKTTGMFNISIVNNNSDWVSASFTPNYFGFSVSTINTSKEARVADIYFILERGGEEQVLCFTVTQLGIEDAELQLAFETVFLSSTGTATLLPINLEAGTTYTISSVYDNTWLSATKTAGGINVGATANINAEERIGTITLVATRGESQVIYTITVIQSGIGGPDVVAPFDKITLPPSGATNYEVDLLNVDAATALSVYFIEQDWLSASINGSKVVLSAGDNSSSSSRTCKVAILSRKGEQNQIFYIEVTQSGTNSPSLVILKNDYTFSHNGTTYTALNRATSNFYDICVADLDNADYFVVKSMPDWMSMLEGRVYSTPLDNGYYRNASYFQIQYPSSQTLSDYTSVFSENDIRVGLLDNPSTESRSGYVVIAAYKNDCEDITYYNIKITQNGVGTLDLKSPSTEISLANTGAQVWYYINNPDGAAYIGYSAPEWVHVSCTTLTGVFSLKISANANTSAKARTAAVVFTFKLGNQYQDITLLVTQAGTESASITAPCQEIVLPAEGFSYTEDEESPYNVALTNINGDLSLRYIEDGWEMYYETSVSETNNTGFITFKECEANYTGQERSLVVTVYAHNAVNGTDAFVNIRVTQPAASDAVLSLPVSSLVFGSDEYDITNAVNIPYISNNSSDEQVSSTDSDWLLVSLNKYYGYITIYPRTNNTGEIRSAVIYLTAINSIGKPCVTPITVVQLSEPTVTSLQVYTPDNGIWDESSLNLALDNMQFKSIDIKVRSNNAITVTTVSPVFSDYSITYDRYIYGEHSTETFTGQAENNPIPYRTAGRVNYWVTDDNSSFCGDYYYLGYNVSKSGGNWNFNSYYQYSVNCNDTSDDFENIENFYTWLGFNATINPVANDYFYKKWEDASEGNYKDLYEYYGWTWDNAVSMTAGENVLKVAAWKNYKSVPRKGYIIINAGNGVIRTITVTQNN